MDQSEIYAELAKTPRRWINGHTLAKRLNVRPLHSYVRKLRRVCEVMHDLDYKILNPKQMARFLENKKNYHPQKYGYIVIKR